MTHRRLLRAFGADCRRHDRLSRPQNRLPYLIGQNTGVDAFRRAVFDIADHENRLATVGTFHRAGFQHGVDAFFRRNLPVFEVNLMNRRDSLIGSGVDPDRSGAAAGCPQKDNNSGGC